jgi:hypothetical protein
MQLVQTTLRVGFPGSQGYQYSILPELFGLSSGQAGGKKSACRRTSNPPARRISGNCLPRSRGLVPASSRPLVEHGLRDFVR